MRRLSERAFDQIVFDLDDTLLDTYQQLIPQASLESCRAMVDAGLATDEQSCLRARSAYVQAQPRQGLYSHLVRHFGVREGADPDGVARIGYDAFHVREVESDIALFDGARELIQSLSQTYRVHLVTAGNRPTQEAKIRILGIQDLFSSIHHVDPSRGERKQSAFAEILQSADTLPERCLSIGNRLDTDIADAKKIGWRTCWMRYGEYAHMLPRDEFEKPDYEIRHLGELIKTCGL